VHAAERNHSWNATAGPDDDAAADLLAEDAVGRPDVFAPFRRDRRRLQAEPVLADRPRSLVHDRVLAVSSGLQREIETEEVELDSGHLGSQDAQGFLQQFLPGLVPLQHHDRFVVHPGGH
jgi:hypothetical protein